MIEADVPQNSRRAWFPAILLIAAVFVWIAPTLRWMEFTNAPENLNVATALEMRRGGPWLVPNLQGEVRAAKPPLAAWITAAFIRPKTMSALSSPDPAVRDRAFTQLEWQTRWPALLSACLMLLATFLLGRAIGGDMLGLLSVAICATTLMFLRFARIASTDTQLALWVTAGNWLLAEAVIRRRIWLGFIGAGVALALAFMSKGPVCLLQSIWPVALFALWRGWRARSDEPITPKRARAIAAMVIGVLVFLLLAAPWFIYVARHYNVAELWFSEVTRIHAREAPSSPPYIYLVIFAYMLPWLVFFVVGLIVLARQMFQHRQIQETLALFLFVVPIVTMVFFRDREDRYLLPMLAPAAIIAARGLLEHLRSWDRWTREDTLATALHWGTLMVIVVGLPIIGSTTLLKRVDGAPWYPREFAYPAAFTGFVLILLAIYAHRMWRGALVLATFVLMLIMQAIFIIGYANSDNGRAETRPLAESIATLYPDADLFNAHPEGKRPPTDIGVYVNRTIHWVADPSTIPASDKPQVLLMLQNHGEPMPKPPTGWELIDVRYRGKDLWYAYVREPKGT
jgi:4-amino-4-deoxy-L-arabinose transferase-like glycosyltransferase